MERTVFTTRLALWLNRLICLLVIALLPALPFLLQWYSGFRTLSGRQCWAILIGFYCCAIVILLALWKVDRLLRNILKLDVFTRENVGLLRFIRWCCGGVSLICIPVGVIYMPILFVVIIMAFLFLMVSVLVRVMDAAVLIREENDLTI